MPKGGFNPQATGNPLIDQNLQALAKYLGELDSRITLGRLEPEVLVPLRSEVMTGGTRVVVYRGRGGHIVTLPLATSVGVSKALPVHILNAGPGTLTVAAVGNDTVNLAKTMTLAAGELATGICDGAQAWTLLRSQAGGGAVGAAWFSPVDSALLVGATSAVADLTVGPKFRPTVDMTCRGIRFYWKSPAGSPTTRTVRVSLWDADPVSPALLERDDLVLAADGEYSFEFAARTLTAYKIYLASLWDTHGTSGSRVYTHTSNEEVGGGGYPGGPLDSTTPVLQTTFWGPGLLFAGSMKHPDDSLPDTVTDKVYPTELILDDVVM